jgi:hypothetical protein
VAKDNSLECYLKFKDKGYGMAINNSQITFGLPVPVGIWTHVVFTFEGGVRRDTKKLYENGTLKGTIFGSHQAIKGSSKPFRIGARSKEYTFHGKLDEVRIYNRLLAPEEISLLAQRKVGGSPAKGP